MTRNDLVFNWRTSESQVGSKIVATLIVTIIFAIGFALVDVDLLAPKTGVLESATVLHFADDELGRAWRLKAEENGPFPGRLEIDGAGVIPDIDRLTDYGGVGGWNGYDVALRRFQAAGGEPSVSLARKGMGYLPGRVKIFNGDLAGVPDPVRKRKAILTPFDDQALGWMPEEVPDFQIPVAGGDLLSASWRFMLRLRADGSVSDCISLSGGGDAGLEETTEWLRGLRFNPGEDGRWLGLRVEFVN